MILLKWYSSPVAAVIHKVAAKAMSKLDELAVPHTLGNDWLLDTFVELKEDLRRMDAEGV